MAFNNLQYELQQKILQVWHQITFLPKIVKVQVKMPL